MLLNFNLLRKRNGKVLRGKKPHPNSLFFFVPELAKCFNGFLDRRFIYLTKKIFTLCYQALFSGLVIASWF